MSEVCKAHRLRADFECFFLNYYSSIQKGRGCAFSPVFRLDSMSASCRDSLRRSGSCSSRSHSVVSFAFLSGWCSAAPRMLLCTVCFLLVTLLSQKSSAYSPMITQLNYLRAKGCSRSFIPSKCVTRNSCSRSKRGSRSTFMAASPPLTRETRYFGGSDFDNIDWRSPIAKGNFGSVYYGRVWRTNEKCAIKCPNLEEFSLKCYQTEVN